MGWSHGIAEFVGWIMMAADDLEGCCGGGQLGGGLTDLLMTMCCGFD